MVVVVVVVVVVVLELAFGIGRHMVGQVRQSVVDCIGLGDTRSLVQSSPA